MRFPQSRLHQRYDLVRRVVWEVAADEEAAAWREADLIFALRPPYNADPGLRVVDPVGKDARVPYIVVGDRSGMACFTLEPDVPSAGRAYGCFPHLGKGAASHRPEFMRPALRRRRPGSVITAAVRRPR
ncbi:hypothetical protein E1295_00250 [Nonomuraea mesophila]|uniref:Uncharacterized protein n=1 Tax=Nonomuraea mesophila TaxID=2530382 RepID=A0A4R5FXS8_9ACTN|nr:hypothetical protein [Nonomuraea mesophila]TDE60314.1 hypothetical protein E1295_00250 [Nonomuraea mesophila]